jgi:hypothetical protein
MTNLYLARPALADKLTTAPAPVVILKGRRADAVRILHPIPCTKPIATALRVAPRTIQRWRTGTCTPTVRHWRQLTALRGVLHATCQQ